MVEIWVKPSFSFVKIGLLLQKFILNVGKIKMEYFIVNLKKTHCIACIVFKNSTGVVVRSGKVIVI